MATRNSCILRITLMRGSGIIIQRARLKVSILEAGHLSG
jgi:hypothetical protein